MAMPARFEPRLLSTLEAVARLGSSSSAAEELGFTQSAVSQQVAVLECKWACGSPSDARLGPPLPVQS